MVTLSLLLIFVSLSLSFPVWHTFFVEGWIAALVNCLASAIHLTRGEAIERGQLMTLCCSSDGKHCDGRWNEG